jgi:CubicO group peptidase (beta-lactamase class C family)
MSRKFSLTLVIILSLTTVCYCQAVKGKQLQKDLDKYLMRFRGNEPGCAILVSKGGQTLYEKAYGLSNLDLSVPNQPSTVFRIGSVTKQFTAVAILQLVEKGMLSLNDSIQKFIPDFLYRGYTVNIEHLLTHTSGIKEYLSIDHPDPFVLRRDFKPKELIDFFKNEPLEFKPGSKWAYSNSGYFLLGYIIELVSGQAYGAYVSQHIFQPCGMTESYYGDNLSIVRNRANGYKPHENNYENAEYRSPTIAYSAGALLSTVGDLNKWHRALVTNTLISGDLLRKAWQGFMLSDGQDSNYGYGWFVNAIQVHGSPTVAHTGGIAGFTAIEMYLPKEDVFVTVLSNLDENPKVQETAMYAASLAIGKKPGDEVVIDKSILETYKGRYRMKEKPSRIALVKEQEGMLIIEVVNEWKAALSATGLTTFEVKNIKPSATLEFLKDDSGKISKFVVIQAGSPTEWNKIE